MLCHVALVRSDVSEECSSSIIRMTSCMLRLLVTADVVPSSQIFVTLMMEEICSSEMLVLTRATWWKLPEDGILHNHSRENLRSYKQLQYFGHVK
jgi:hypothetical protein